MTKDTATTEEQKFDGAIKEAQKQADTLTKEQIKNIIEATRVAELEALTAAEKYYNDLKKSPQSNPSKNLKNNIDSILQNIEVTKKTVSEGVSSKLHQKLVQDQELISTTDNLEKEVQQAAKHWKKIAATRNDDRPSSLSLASDHIMSIAKYSANTVPAAYNVAWAVAEYTVMTIVADSITKGFDHLAQIYKKGKQYSDVTREWSGSVSILISYDQIDSQERDDLRKGRLQENPYQKINQKIGPIDPKNLFRDIVTHKDQLTDFPNIVKQSEYFVKAEKALDQLSEDVQNIVKKLNLSPQQNREYNRCKDSAITASYFIQSHVEKLPKQERPDLTLLKQHRNELINAYDNTLLTKVTATLIGIIGSGTQAIMAPIRIALTTTSNIAYTPIGIYKNYQSYKKDDKGNVKNWAKSTAIIRQELTAKRKEKAQASFAQTVQKRNARTKKGSVKSY